MIDLLKASGQQPRFHGNGFVQLYLQPDVRLHVWHPGLPALRGHNATIHNHRYDVRSTVYAGLLHHITYRVRQDTPTEEHDVRIVQLDGASDAHKTPEVETGVTGRLEERHSYHLAAGSSYTMRRPWFHASVHEGAAPIVTVFERSNKGAEWAQVLCGINDAQATHAFDPATQPSVQTCWDAIESALAGGVHPALRPRLHTLLK